MSVVKLYRCVCEGVCVRVCVCEGVCEGVSNES